MKLQELLQKGNFDKMYEHIVKFDPYSEGNRFAYLTAYELLCIMKVREGREYKVDFNFNAWIHDKSKEITPFLCSSLEGSNWKKALGAEMVLCPEAENVHLDMIAAVCLWHITYYGFTPEDQEKIFTTEQEENRYQEIKDHEKKAEELLRILVGDMETEKPKEKGFLERLIDHIWGTGKPCVPHGPAMIDSPNLGKNNHKLLNTEAKDRMKKEIKLLEKLFEECCKELK